MSDRQIRRLDQDFGSGEDCVCVLAGEFELDATNDHLGSPRINTDGVGAVISRHDYHPLGVSTVEIFDS